tara:strand:- start:885 stop:1097 length:213 start_codon:yes stop_codon:yes gene_type:complete
MINAKREIKSTLALYGHNLVTLATYSALTCSELSHFLNKRRIPTPEKLERLQAAYKELTGYTLPDLGEDK